MRLKPYNNSNFKHTTERTPSYFLLLLTVVALFTQSSWAVRIPCPANPVIVLQKDLTMMPCSLYDTIQFERNYMTNYFPITVTEITVTGWYYLHNAGTTTDYRHLFAIQNLETTTTRQKYFSIIYMISSRYFMIDQNLATGVTGTINSQLNSAGANYNNYFLGKWVFVFASISLTTKKSLLLAYIPSLSLTYPSASPTQQNSHASIAAFVSSNLITWGNNIMSPGITNYAPGCGQSMNIRLYTNLYIDNSVKPLNHMYFLKGDAEDVLYYPMNLQSNNVLLFDASGNNNHAYTGTSNNPVWNTNNEGLKFSALTELQLPIVKNTKKDLFVSFWYLQSSVAQAGDNYVIIRGIQVGGTKTEVFAVKSVISGTQRFTISIYGQTFSYTAYGTITQNSWTHFAMSCNNVPQTLVATLTQFICHFKKQDNTAAVFNVFTTPSVVQLSKTYFRYVLGDKQSNGAAGYFVLKDLVITDGAMFNTRDATLANNCVPNCETYLSNGRCLACQSGYYLTPTHTCILAASCTPAQAQDTNIYRCRSTAAHCADELKTVSSSCVNCINEFTKVGSETTCTRCPYNCQTCGSTLPLQCASCQTTRNADAPTCSCPVNFYDDKIFPMCINQLTPTLKQAPLTKYLNLTQTYIVTQCYQLTQANQNKFSYNQMQGPSISTISATVLSFSIWTKNEIIKQYQSIILLKRLPYDAGTNILHFYLNYITPGSTGRFYLQSTSSINMQSNYPYINQNQWVWSFLTFDVGTKQLAFIHYYPNVHQWYYYQSNTNFHTFTTFDYSDMRLYVGTQAYVMNQPNYCLHQGYLRDLYLYYGLHASTVTQDVRMIRGLLRYPDYPVMNFSMTTKQQVYTNIISDFSGITLTFGSTSAVEAGVDPDLHWYNGLTFLAGQFATISSYTLSDFTLHYWGNKANPTTQFADFITFQRLTTGNVHLISIHHLARGTLGYFLLQVCVLENCFLHTSPMRAKYWSFIAVSFGYNNYDEVYVEAYVNTQMMSYIFQIDASTYWQTTDVTTLGSSLNTNTDPFYIKDFVIDMGGMIHTYIMDGYHATKIPSKCLLRYVHSNSTTSTICLMCEQGYAIQLDGTCMPEPRYCDLSWNLCQPVCPDGKFRDIILLDCVSTCAPGYFKDRAIMTCVQVCTVGSYKCDSTNYCETTCPPGQLADGIITQSCVTQCPVGSFGLVAQGKCYATCPLGIFEYTPDRLCLCLCPSGYYGDTVANKCVQQCPAGLYAYGPTRMCQLGCETLYADPTQNQCVMTCPSNSTHTYYGDMTDKQCKLQCQAPNITDIIQRMCVAKCSKGLFANPVTNNCSETCPTGTYGDLLTSTCSSSCYTGKFWLSSQSECVVFCPAPYFANKQLLRCTTDCKSQPGIYEYAASRECVTNCIDPLFADDTLQQCVLVCQTGYFADSTTRKCKTKCPDKFFGDTLTHICQKQCTGLYYADSTTNECVLECPTKYRKSLSGNVCLGDCSAGQFYDQANDSCGATCPEGTFADPESSQCLKLDYSCVDQYCINPISHLCIKMNLTYSARQITSYNCTRLNQAVEVDQCLLSSDDICIQKNSTMTMCISLTGNNKNALNNICDCPTYQCIQKIEGTENYECVNMTSDINKPGRIGREIDTKYCLGSDDIGLRKGALSCVDKYCIDNITRTCTHLYSTHPKKYFARQAESLICTTINDASVDVDDCAAGKFCVDRSLAKKQCIFIDNLPYTMETTEDKFATACNVEKDQCMRPSNQENYTIVSIEQSLSQITSKGRETRSLKCLDANESNVYGAERCSFQYCIDVSTKSCHQLDLVTFQARNALNHQCALLNAAVGVDSCTLNSTYCIDTQSDPSRCSDLLSPYTCYIGREIDSQICVFDGTIGPNKFGVNYCKKGYCIFYQNGVSSCEALANKPGLYAKNITTFCIDAMIPNSVECAPKFCLDNVDNSCQPFSKQRQGKDKVTQKCIEGGGSYDISECAEDYCKVKIGDLFYCKELNDVNYVTKENNTHNCMGLGEKTSQGILQCGPAFCIFEVLPGFYTCSQQQNFANGMVSGASMSGSNYKKLSACKSVNITNFVFDQINMTSSAIFEIINSPKVVISNLTISNTNMKNGSKIMNIINSENVTIEGEIKLINVTLSEKSTFVYIQNATIETLGDQVISGVTISQNSKFMDIQDINNVTIKSITISNSTVNKAKLVNFRCMAGNVNVLNQSMKNVKMSDLSTFFRIDGCEEEDQNYGKDSIIHVDEFVAENNTLINSNMFEGFNFKNIDIQKMNLDSITLTNSKLFFGENGESFKTTELKFNNIVSDYIVKRSSYPLFDTYNISNISIDKIIAQDAGLTEYTSLLRIDTAKKFQVAEVQLLKSNVSIVPFLEFLNVDNLILDKVNAVNMTTKESTCKQAILIHDSTNVTINNVNIEDADITSPLYRFAGNQNLMLGKMNFKQSPGFVSKVNHRRLQQQEENKIEGEAQLVWPTLPTSRIEEDKDTNEVSQRRNLQSVTGLTLSQAPILRFENSESINLAGETVLDMNNVPFQYADFQNCKNIQISNVVMQSQRYESEYPLFQFQQITGVLKMENVTIKDVTFANNTQFIRLVDTNITQLVNFTVDQIVLDSYLLWMSQIRNLLMKRLIITNIVAAPSKTKDFPVINVEAAREQLLTQSLFQYCTNVAFIHAFDLYEVFKFNETALYNESAMQTFEWTDTLVSVDDIQVYDVALRDYSAVKLQGERVDVTSSSLERISCQTCNGSALFIYEAKMKIFNVLCKHNSAVNGGCLYAVKCPQQADFYYSQFMYNKAVLSGGAIYTDEAFFFMQGNEIKYNTALVGGGIRYLGMIPKQIYYSSYIRLRATQFNANNNDITINRADIYGQNVASYIGGIQVNTTKGYFKNVFNISDIRSGQNLINYFNLTIIDQFGELVNITKHNWELLLNLTNQNNPPSLIVDEFYKTQLEVQFESVSLKLEGDLLLGFKFNFDYDTLQFQFQKINILGVPGELRTFYISDLNVMQPSKASGRYEWQQFRLQVNANFRECAYGEIYTQILQFYECTFCDDGKYSLVKPKKDDFTQKCMDCPFDKAEKCIGDEMVIRYGYWRRTKDTDLIVECISKAENCIGGTEYGSKLCLIGHIGALCEECDIHGFTWGEPYSRYGVMSCAQCSHMEYNHIILALQTIWTFVSLIISINIDLRTSNNVANNAKASAMTEEEKKQLAMQGTKVQLKKVDAVSPLLKITINYLQIVASVSKLDIVVPYGILSIFDQIGRPIQQSMYSIDCIFVGNTGTIPIIYFRVILSLVLSLCYQVFFIIGYRIYTWVMRKPLNYYIFSTSFMFFVVFLQPEIVSQMLSVISCRTIGIHDYILGNVSYECYNDQFWYYALVLVAPFLILWVFILPLSILYNLNKNAKRLNDVEVRLKYGFMFREYRDQVYYWEFIKIYLKVLITILINQYAMEIRVKGSLICCVIIIYATLSINIKPYKQVICTKMDQMSVIIAGISVYLGVFMYKNTYSYWQALGIVSLAFLNMYCLIKLLFTLLAEYTPKFDEWLDKKKINFIKCFPLCGKYIQMSKHSRTVYYFQKLKLNLLEELRKERKKEFRAILVKQDPTLKFESPSPKTRKSLSPTKKLDFVVPKPKEKENKPVQNQDLIQFSQINLEAQSPEKKLIVPMKVEDSPTVHENPPFVEIPIPQPQQEIKEPEPIKQEPPKEEPKPVVEEPKPVIEEPKPVIEEPKPIVEEPKPVFEEPKPVVVEQPPVQEKPNPPEEVKEQSPQKEDYLAKQEEPENQLADALGGDKKGASPALKRKRTKTLKAFIDQN